jgi:hypothetical protein
VFRGYGQYGLSADVVGIEIFYRIHKRRQHLSGRRESAKQIFRQNIFRMNFFIFTQLSQERSIKNVVRTPIFGDFLKA